MATRLFPLGKTCITPGALKECELISLSPSRLLDRHVQGDWSEMDKEDQMFNRQAISAGSRIFSAYTCRDCTFYVITEADRSVTTVLLPEEY